MKNQIIAFGLLALLSGFISACTASSGVSTQFTDQNSAQPNAAAHRSALVTPPATTSCVFAANSAQSILSLLFHTPPQENTPATTRLLGPDAMSKYYGQIRIAAHNNKQNMLNIIGEHQRADADCLTRNAQPYSALSGIYKNLHDMVSNRALDEIPEQIARDHQTIKLVVPTQVAMQ